MFVDEETIHFFNKKNPVIYIVKDNIWSQYEADNINPDNIKQLSL